MLSFEIGCSGQSICFTEKVLEHFYRYRQLRCYHREAGGQLFAEPCGQRIQIVEATGPRKSDLRTRKSYIPDRNAENREIAEQHTLGRIFVGDWHTHPDVIPTPSLIDCRSIQECFVKSTIHVNGLVLVIVGTGRFPQSLFVSVSDGTHTHQLTAN